MPYSSQHTAAMSSRSDYSVYNTRGEGEYLFACDLALRIRFPPWPALVQSKTREVTRQMVLLACEVCGSQWPGHRRKGQISCRVPPSRENVLRTRIHHVDQHDPGQRPVAQVALQQGSLVCSKTVALRRACALACSCLTNRRSSGCSAAFFSSINLVIMLLHEGVEQDSTDADRRPNCRHGGDLGEKFPI